MVMIGILLRNILRSTSLSRASLIFWTWPYNVGYVVVQYENRSERYLLLRPSSANNWWRLLIGQPLADEVTPAATVTSADEIKSTLACVLTILNASLDADILSCIIIPTWNDILWLALASLNHCQLSMILSYFSCMRCYSSGHKVNNFAAGLSFGNHEMQKASYSAYSG